MCTRPTIVDTHRDRNTASHAVALLLTLVAVACRNPSAQGAEAQTETGSTRDAGRASNDTERAPDGGTRPVDAGLTSVTSRYAVRDASVPREASVGALDASHGDLATLDAPATSRTDLDASRAPTDAATCEFDACNSAGTCIRRDQWTECGCAPRQLPACDFPRFRAIGTSRTDRERTLYLLSGDGHVVAGAHAFDAASPTSVGVTWTPEGGLRALAQDPAGPTLPTDINDDGSLITGVIELDRGETIAVIWSDGVLTRVSPDAGLLPPRKHAGRVPPDGAAATRYFDVFDASEDGRVLVGRTRRSYDNSRTEAAFWTPDDGVQFLSEYLAARGVDMHDWDLWHINAVSDDGNTMIGLGIGPDVGYRWYLQLVPPPR